MNTQKVVFENKDEQTLVGCLEMPVDRHPHSFVIFAHCFTCGKNVGAARNIARTLSSKGFGVLRFDFTGLGESQGDFTDTNFSGNVEDLVAAATFLEENYKAPTLIIGHSLGGAAAIFAAAKITSIQALVTIAAPSSPLHVAHLFTEDLDSILEKEKILVRLGGREFTIKKHFFDDLQTKSLPETLHALRKPLLILHSPQDGVVAIKNAEEIYKASHHPKSFVSLDGADHMLSSKEDDIYAGQVIAGWASRYVKASERVDSSLSTTEQVVARLLAEDGFTTQMKVGNHYLLADEPLDFGGNDFGPNPYEIVAAALSACTAMTLQLYAKRKKWPLTAVEVHTSYRKQYAGDCENCEDPMAKIDTFYREIHAEGTLDADQRKRLISVADKCPVHKTLEGKAQIITKIASRIEVE